MGAERRPLREESRNGVQREDGTIVNRAALNAYLKEINRVSLLTAGEERDLDDWVESETDNNRLDE